MALIKKNQEHKPNKTLDKNRFVISYEQLYKKNYDKTT